MKRIDIVGLAFALFCIAMACFGLSRLQSNTEDVLQWLPDQSEARVKYDLFESKFGSDDFLILTWDGCTVDDPRLVTFTNYIREHDTEGLFQQVTNGAEVVIRLAGELKLSRASIQRRLRGVFFGSQDVELTCAFLELSPKGTANRSPSMQIVWEAIDELPDLERDEVAIGGYPYIATFLDSQLGNSFRNFLIPSVVLSTLLALFCLRNIALTLIVFVAAMGAATSSVAFIPLCNMKYGGLMSIIPALVFVLATSGSIHLIRYSLDAIGDAKKLLRIGWRPCVVSAATTSVGMLSLLRSDFPAIRNFGLFCAVGVGFALMFQLLIVPWLLERFGQKGLTALAGRSENSTVWNRVIGLVHRHKYLVSLVSMGLMVLGGFGLTKLTAEVEVEKLFQPDSEILLSIADLESRLGPMDQTELLVQFSNDKKSDVKNQVDLQSDVETEGDAPRLIDPFKESFPERVDLIRRLQSELSKAPEVDVIYSLVNFLPPEPSKSNARNFFKRSTYRNVLRRERKNLANSNLLNVDGETEIWRISIRFPFTQKKDFEKLQNEVVNISTRVVGDFAAPKLEQDGSIGSPNQSLNGSSNVVPQVVYTGKTHLFHHAQLNLLADLYQNFLLAFVIITPMLIIVLRSVSLGLIAMLPNLFPTLIVFGGLGWTGYPVDLAIAMTACVALGIAVDDTTHFLIRFRDYGGRMNQVFIPVQRTIAQCGPAMFHTTLIGGAGLFVYYFSDMLVVSRFSWAIATLLVIALVADVLMLPAILFVLGRDDNEEKSPNST